MSVIERIKKLFSLPEELILPDVKNNLKDGVKVKDLKLKNRYKTNLIKKTCECPEYIKYQHDNYRKNDIRRMCKHLLTLYKECIDFSEASEINKTIINNGYSVRGNFILILLKNEDEEINVGITYNRDNSWIDIFAPDDKKKYRRYGYNIDELIWAKKEKPNLIYKELEEYIQRNI